MGGVLALFATTTTLLLGAAPARADFTETFCAASAPAAPWVSSLNASGGFAGGSVDSCVAADNTSFYLQGDSMTAGQDAATGIQAPAGETISGVQIHYDTIPSTTGQPFLRIYHDAFVFLVDAPMGNATAGTDVQTSLVGASEITFDVYCSLATTCDFTAPNPLTVGRVSLTLHDTGVPSVQATGGGLTPGATVHGGETIGYSATDSGSGVAKVTASLGSTVVATATPSCQSPALSPCPPTTTGTLSVDTTQLPDGTYPLSLTAYDESGDPATTQVGSVTIANHRAVGMGTAPVAIIPRPRPRHVHVKLVLAWHWAPRHTRLGSVVFVKMSRRASVAVTCAGKRCPRARWSARTHRGVVKLRHHLAGRSFAAGDRLTITIRVPGKRRERVSIRIRPGRRPAMILR